MLSTYSHSAFLENIFCFCSSLVTHFFNTLPVDAVAGVNLIVPAVAMEGRNVSLRCTWTAGTDITVQWGKGGAAIVTDARITISGGFLVINPARRSDAGDYSCTVSNPVSAQTTTQSVTVYCEFDQDKWPLICCSHCKQQ